ncbi:MAG: hypothetical protein O3C57_01795 [Verrucomicrobia bacterium]|nr:hypothetical protein [Verrucomicrobiota bacterium]
MQYPHAQHSFVHTVILLALLLANTPRPGLGQTVGNTRDRASEIAAAIQDLAHQDHARREAASETLWAMAEEAEPAIRHAATNDDPEVALRAKALLASFNQGVRPETSVITETLIQRFKVAKGFQKAAFALVLMNTEDAGPRTVLRLITNEPVSIERQLLARSIAPAVQGHLSDGLSRGDDVLADTCLRLGMLTGDDEAFLDVVAFHTVRGDIAQTRQLLEAGDDTPDTWRALAWLHRSQGHLASAINAADKAQRPEFARMLREELGQWETLGEALEKSPRPEDIEWLGYRAAYARLGGQTNRFASTIRDIEQHATRNPDNAWFATEALLVNDQMDQAIALVLSAHLYDLAARLLYQRRDFARLLALADTCIADEANRQDVGLLIDIAARIRSGDHRMRELPLEMLAENLQQHPKSALQRGDDAVDAGDVQGAIALYRTAAQDHPGDALPVYLEGLTRIQNGEVEEGNALIRRATLYPLAQDARRARLAYGLDLRHHTVEAGQQWQHLWRHAAPDSVYRIDIAPRLAAQKVREKQLYAEAVRDLEVSQLPLLRKNTSVADVTMAVTVRSMIARYQVLEALARNDIAAAHRRLERAKKILPLDIELAIAVHHAVKNGAHEALGQSLFDETFQALQALCKQYPLLAELHNETAWLAARCGKTLDVAEILARRAVSLDPESPEYLDTLAEVLFQGQKREQAILLMQRCIELDPEMPYFQRQLTRFQTGNPSRPPPE